MTVRIPAHTPTRLRAFPRGLMPRSTYTYAPNKEHGQ
jgi:hypothetical protein